ncbi:acyl-CoA dehydrogenase [Streptomyces sp. NPDC090106]|uniref:acyl-CoA dehydrogenase n=1 Tax=Streptomyces sp. NPDC090106 TaxID=3365946 RepID=UPI00380512F9
MNHYRTNLRDVAFVIRELLGQEVLDSPEPFGRIDLEHAQRVLAEADRFAADVLVPLFPDATRESLRFDPETRCVPMSPPFLEVFAAYLESGWLDLDLSPEPSGQWTPPSLRLAVLEIMLGANPSIPTGAYLVPLVVRLLHARDTPDHRQLAELIVDRGWTVGMPLTEPDVGFDACAVSTVASPQPDGSWHLEGAGRSVVHGDHETTENVMHLVLARPIGVSDTGDSDCDKPSLFVVPEFGVDLGSGGLSDRNGVLVIRHKGFAGEPTPGGGAPTVGWLLGDERDGVRQILEIVKAIHVLVGVKSMTTLSTGYFMARDYAAERVQSGTPLEDRRPESVAIIEHSDIRHSLMTQKAHAEGMRALILYAGSLQDRLTAARQTGAHDRFADATHQMLLPVIKGYCSETTWRVLGQGAMRVLAISGHPCDYPLEQYVRDAVVDSLYGGPTGTQGLLLFSSTILKDEGAALDALLDEVAATAERRLDDTDEFTVERRQLHHALQAFRVLFGLLLRRWEDQQPDGPALVAQDTTRFLLAMGDLLCGWLLLRSAEVAAYALMGDGPDDTDVSFYQGKVASGRHFARTVLPCVAADLVAAGYTDDILLSLPNAAF